MKTSKKLILLVIAILVIGSSTVFAADNITNIKGFFSNTIKVFNNGQQVSLGVDEITGQPYKPLVTDGRTYIPVRALANVLGKNIDWQQNNVYITDKYDSNYNQALMQLIEKQTQITKLEAKVKDLEAQLEGAKTNKPSTTSDLQKFLNTEYGKYENIDFDIVISGTTNKINAKIYVDKSDNSRWKSLSSTKVKNYIEDIVDDIEYYFPKASIEGYIENEYNDKIEVDFFVNSSGKLVIDTDYTSGNYDIDDLEDDLNDYYKDFYFYASEDGYDLELEIYVDYYKWFKSFDSYDRDEYLEDIYDFIMEYYDYDSISGDIYDEYYNDLIGYFTFDAKGNVNLREY